MGNGEEIRCALNATERPLSNCRTYKANPSRTICIYWRAFIFTSFGSYFAKKMYSRICSWIAYAPFITLLLVIWHQDITTSSIIANAKIAACVALIPCLFRFRTYGLTLGLFSLWAALLWDIKVQSLVILERMTSLMTSHYVYILLLIGGLVLGGLLAMFIHRKEKDNNKENINLLGKETQKIII